MFRPFMILFMAFVDRRLNINLLLILNFVFIAFILWWKANFLIMELILSFPDDTEVSSDQLKRFDESVVDPKCLLKIQGTSIFFLLKFILLKQYYLFLYITIFILEVRFICFPKWFGIYNQHEVPHSTAIWLIYSDFPPGFVVT